MTAPASDVPLPALADLPHVVPVPLAGRYWGLGRDSAYRLARSGRFPVQVLTLGRKYVVTRASLIAVLDPAPGADPGVAVEQYAGHAIGAGQGPAPAVGTSDLVSLGHS